MNINIINDIPLEDFDSLNIFNDLTIDLSEFSNSKITLELKKIKKLKKRKI